MATLLQTANALVALLDSSIDGFVTTLPETDRRLYNEIINLTKDLKTLRGGKIEASVQNWRLIGRIRSTVDRVLREKPYLNQVKEFKLVYGAINEIQKEYFSLITVKFHPPAVLREVKKQAVSEVVSGLTERGLGADVSKEITEILRTNIRSSSSYAQLTEQLRDAIKGLPEESGIMERYAKVLVTDSVNQYTATYSKIVSDDLGFEWYQYVGSLITTSRPICIALVNKRYVHKSEFSKIINGTIDGKKVSLRGFNPATTVESFPILRGGFNCRHQLLPVAEAMVPQAIRIEMYSKLGIEYDEQGFRMAA